MRYLRTSLARAAANDGQLRRQEKEALVGLDPRWIAGRIQVVEPSDLEEISSSSVMISMSLHVKSATSS